MITGAGFQFWNGGLCPLLDREGRLRARARPAPAARRGGQRPRLSPRMNLVPPTGPRSGGRVALSQYLTGDIRSTGDCYHHVRHVPDPDRHPDPGRPAPPGPDPERARRPPRHQPERGRPHRAGQAEPLPGDARPGRREARQRVRLARPQRPPAPADRRRPQASGSIPVKTSKNAAVALLCASLLNKGRTTLRSLARIEEVNRIIEVLDLDRRPGALAARQQRPRDRAPGQARPREHRHRRRPPHPHRHHVPRPAAARAAPPSSCRTPVAATSAPAPSSRTCRR